MPQISLYIDQMTLKRIEEAAKLQHISISKWVADQLRNKLEPAYPPGFADLFGSVQDPSFRRPEQLNPKSDSRRATL